MTIQIEKCGICTRELKNPNSVARGCGDICAANYASGIQAAGASYQQIEGLQATFKREEDAMGAKWVQLSKQAMVQGKIALAKDLLERAKRRALLVDGFRCVKCEDTGFISERQDTGVTGVSFRADTECDCHVPTTEPESILCATCNDVFCLCLKEAA